MGARDSTQTRVIPVFDALSHSYLPRLIRLVSKSGPKKTSLIEDARWGSEKALRPPVSLLKNLVENPQPQFEGPLGSSPKTIEKRRALLDGERTVLDEARRLLGKQPLPLKAWYILEGPSFPDVFIQTADAILVVEGKRTEPNPTRATSWMPVRDQLLRHIDCAWEIRGTRQVYGMMIVEGENGESAEDVPKRWQHWIEETTQNRILEASLPHRTPDERKEIAASVLGITTWQNVCREFGIDWNSLPDLCD